MENAKATTIVEYELYPERKIRKEDFEELENQIKKICEIHDGKHELRIKVKNWYKPD